MSGKAASTVEAAPAGSRSTRLRYPANAAEAVRNTNARLTTTFSQIGRPSTLGAWGYTAGHRGSLLPCARVGHPSVHRGPIDVEHIRERQPRVERDRGG